MGHSTTVYGWVAEYLAERFIEHPQWGQSRRIESIIPLALRPWRPAVYRRSSQETAYQWNHHCDQRHHGQCYLVGDAPVDRGPHRGVEEKLTAMPVRTPTTIPATMEPMARPISLLSAGDG